MPMLFQVKGWHDSNTVKNEFELDGIPMLIQGWQDTGALLKINEGWTE